MTRKPDERPIIQTLSKEKKPLDIEIFQNHSLRPILKMKNDILLEFFKMHLQEKKINWTDKNNAQKEDFILNKLSKDHKFKNAIIHLIIGNFSISEYKQYNQRNKEYNKRIWKMFQQRLSSQLF
jgi:hypothetical protein